MLKSNREKTILKQALIIIGIMAALYIFFLNPFLREGKSIMDEELERKTMEIKRYITRTGALPSKESFAKLDKENSALEEKFSKLVDFVDPGKERMPSQGAEAGLYFIEKLHSTMKRFEEDANSKGIKLPENLGFTDGMPKDSMVSVLLRQLEIMEFTIGILLKSGKIEIYSLKPLKAIEYIEPLTKELFYSEVPIQISLKTDNKALINMLAELKNSSPIISVKELHIKSNDVSSDVEATLVLSSFEVKRDANFIE